MSLSSAHFPAMTRHPRSFCRIKKCIQLSENILFFTNLYQLESTVFFFKSPDVQFH